MENTFSVLAVICIFIINIPVSRARTIFVGTSDGDSWSGKIDMPSISGITSLNDAGSVDVASCLDRYCKGPALKDTIAACHQGKYDNCDGMKYNHMEKHFSFAGETHYGDIVDYTLVPNLVAGGEFNDDTDAPLVESFKRSGSKSRSFSWGMAEGVKITISETCEISMGLPGVFGAKFSETVSVETDLSSHQDWSKTATQGWEVDTQVTVPKRSCVKADLVLSEGSGSVPFYINATLTNDAWDPDNKFYYMLKCFYNRPGGNPNGWYTWDTGAAVAKDTGCPNIGSHGDRMSFKPTGTFHGIAAMKQYVNLTQYRVNDCP